MSTRLYVPSAGAPAATPAYGAGWLRTTEAVRRPFNLAKTGTALVELLIDPSTGSGKTERLHVQAIHQLSADVTIDGTLTIAIAGRELVDTAGAGLQVRARVVSSDGLTELAVLYSGDVTTDPSVPPRNFTFTTDPAGATVRTMTCNLTPFAAPAGALLVVELGVRQNYSGSIAGRYGTIAVGDPLVDDQPFTHGSPTPTLAPWVEFSSTLVPPQPPTTVEASEVTATTAVIGWTAPAAGPEVTSYELSLAGGAPLDVGNVTEHELTGLAQATSYDVEVRSLAGTLPSEWASTSLMTLEATYADSVSAATLRLYDRLPEHYRDADAGLDYPLLRYLSLLLDQLDPLDVLVARIDYDAEAGGTSDLVDPATANARWLPWLAQLLGVNITGLTVAEQRAALADPETSWDHGTPGALADAAKRGLTGTQAVTITPHQGGDPYVIGIGTLDSETTTLDTFAELMAAAPTWADLHALGTFAIAAAPAPLRAAEEERPAGYNLVRYSTGA